MLHCIVASGRELADAQARAVDESWVPQSSLYRLAQQQLAESAAQLEARAKAAAALQQERDELLRHFEAKCAQAEVRVWQPRVHVSLPRNVLRAALCACVRCAAAAAAASNRLHCASLCLVAGSHYCSAPACCCAAPAVLALRRRRQVEKVLRAKVATLQQQVDELNAKQVDLLTQQQRQQVRGAARSAAVGKHLRTAHCHLAADGRPPAVAKQLLT